MVFTLSKETRGFIKDSTGMSPIEQKSIPLKEYGKMTSESQKKLYSCKNSRVIPPRGSVYLQMGRILSLSKVKRFLSRI